MSRHLTPEQFVDLLDRGVGGLHLPHLRECDSCRNRLATLRATLDTASEVDVPEPSPLFWDHFSARVSAAVAAESVPQPAVGWFRQPWRLAAALSAVAAAALVAAVALRPAAPPPAAPPAVPVAVADRAAAAPVAVSEPFVIDDDEPLALVADLASDLDWDTAAEVGLATRGGADRIVADLTDDERIELQRILADALGSGA